MMPNNKEIPCVDLPGYPKPATTDSLRDYCGVRLVRDATTTEGGTIPAGTYATFVEFQSDGSDEGDPQCLIWVDGHKTRYVVPMDYLEVTN